MSTTLRNKLKVEDQYEGIIDLCQKKCHVEDDTVGGQVYRTDWDLISINEFEYQCRNPAVPTEIVKRYNEEVALFANRGQWFSVREENEFAIRKFELDLTLGSSVDNLPACTLVGEAGVYELHYRNTLQTDLTGYI